MYGSAGGRRQPPYSNHSGRGNKNVQLSSLSSDKKSIKARRTDTSDSQEEILQSDSQFVMVKHDIVCKPHLLPSMVPVIEASQELTMDMFFFFSSDCFLRQG